MLAAGAANPVDGIATVRLKSADGAHNWESRGVGSTDWVGSAGTSYDVYVLTVVGDATSVPGVSRRYATFPWRPVS